MNYWKNLNIEIKTYINDEMEIILIILQIKIKQKIFYLIQNNRKIEIIL